MNMKENNKYRYTDTAERNIRMNQFYIVHTDWESLWSRRKASFFAFGDRVPVLSVVKTGKSQHCAHCYIR